MRNRLAHGYFEIDLNVLWDALMNDMPDLQQKLRLLAHSGSA